MKPLARPGDVAQRQPRLCRKRLERQEGRRFRCFGLRLGRREPAACAASAIAAARSTAQRARADHGPRGALKSGLRPGSVEQCGQPAPFALREASRWSVAELAEEIDHQPPGVPRVDPGRPGRWSRISKARASKSAFLAAPSTASASSRPSATGGCSSVGGGTHQPPASTAHPRNSGHDATVLRRLSRPGCPTRCCSRRPRFCYRPRRSSASTTSRPSIAASGARRQPL